MSRQVRRVHALVASVVMLVASGRGMLGPLDCPQHGIEALPRTTHHAPRTTNDARLTTHASHAPRTTYHAPADAPKPEKPHQHSGCTCLEHCGACQTAGMPSVALRIPEFRVVVEAPRVAPAAATHVPGRPPFQLPFGLAPPAIA